MAYLTGDAAQRARAERTLGRYGPRVGAAGRTVPMLLCALSAWHAGLAQIVLAGSPAASLPLRREVAARYLPFSIVVPAVPGPAQDRLGTLLPFTAAMTPGDGAAAYVCRDFTCRQPVTTAEELRRELAV